MDKKSITIMVVITVAVGAVCFYGGMKYNASKSVTNSQFGNFQMNGSRLTSQGQSRARANGAELVNGTVLGKDDKSITVKMNNGSSKIVFVPTSITVMKSVEASSTEVAVGDNVMVTGTANSDGSVTAQSLQIRTDNFGQRPGENSSQLNQPVAPDSLPNQ